MDEIMVVSMVAAANLFYVAISVVLALVWCVMRLAGYKGYSFPEYVFYNDHAVLVMARYFILIADSVFTVSVLTMLIYKHLTNA